MGNLWNQKLASLWTGALWATNGDVVNAIGNLSAGASSTSTSANINTATTTAASCILTVANPSNATTGVSRAGQTVYVALTTGVVSGATLVTTVTQCAWKALTAGSTASSGTMSWDNNAANRGVFGGGSIKLRWNGYAWQVERLGGLRTPAFA
jgi:hypothetical protein